MPKTESYVETKREECNKSIIQFLSTNGLVPDQEAKYIRSYDNKPASSVWYFLINSDSFDVPKDAPKGEPFDLRLLAMVMHQSSSELQNLQYKSPDGLWSLLLERSYLFTHPEMEKSADINEWEDRLMSSLLLVFDPKGINGFGRYFSPSIFHTYVEGTQVVDQHTEHVPIANLIAVLAPPGIDTICKPIFQSDLVHRTEPTVGAILFDEKHPEHLTGPDYAAKLKMLQGSGNIKYPFIAHVMRLATRRDFLYFDFLKEKLKLDECLLFYKTKEPAVALRRIALVGEREDIECLRFLVGSKALDINAPSPTTGETALHHAAKRGKDGIAVLKTLLLYGAQPDIPDKQGKTPRQIANNNKINIDSIISGEYYKQEFKERILKCSPKKIQEKLAFAGLPNAMSEQFMGDMFANSSSIGKLYNPPGLFPICESLGSIAATSSSAKEGAETIKLEDKEQLASPPVAMPDPELLKAYSSVLFGKPAKEPADKGKQPDVVGSNLYN